MLTFSLACAGPTIGRGRRQADANENNHICRAGLPGLEYFTRAWHPDPDACDLALWTWRWRRAPACAKCGPMKPSSIKNTLDAVGLRWVTVLLVAIMATLVYAGPALLQTWTHDGPTLVTDGGGTGDGFVAGHDFVAFYSASRAVFDGNAALVYDKDFMNAAQHGLVGDTTVGYLAFMYPPTYLLLVSPLALVPYFPPLPCGCWFPCCFCF